MDAEKIDFQTDLNKGQQGRDAVWQKMFYWTYFDWRYKKLTNMFFTWLTD